MATANAFLFKRDTVEELDAWQETIPRIGRSSVLRIDLEKPDEQDLDRLAEELGLGSATRERLAHPLEALETFRSRASGSGETGRLDGLEFLADLIEWVLESYFDAFEEIEVELEDIDAASMSGDLESREEVLARLVDVRREIGRLRRALTSHREAIPALTRPELEAISSSRSADGSPARAIAWRRPFRRHATAGSRWWDRSTSSLPARLSGRTRS